MMPVRYMIHTCPKRLWYVEEFLIPSMMEQGIPRDQIDLWNDASGQGNLRAFVASCKSLDNSFDSHWHLQDDVVLSATFSERAKQYHTEGVVAGFCHYKWDSVRHTGYVHPSQVWLSFQCIHIPDVYASEFAGWFINDAQHRDYYKDMVDGGKDDDIIFRKFLRERHPDCWCMNLYPAMVDHVDYLIGGTTINFERPGEFHRAYYWDEESVVEQLAKRLEIYKERSV